MKYYCEYCNFEFDIYEDMHETFWIILLYNLRTL